MSTSANSYVLPKHRVHAPTGAKAFVQSITNKISPLARSFRTWQTTLLVSIFVLGCVLVLLDIMIGTSIVMTQKQVSFFSPSIVVRDIRFETREPTSPVEVLSPDTVLNSQTKCIPGVLDVAKIQYPSDHRFYTLMKSIGPLPPPVFTEKHMKLCEEAVRFDDHYGFCLPISGRKDEPYCSAPDRMDLLTRQTPDTLCYGSALHMLLIDVYEEFKAAQASPFITYGTLLGAIRNGSTIPFTEDADIGFMKLQKYQLTQLQRRLWSMGYHMFFHNIWRVCIAPTHPLASNLYDPKRDLSKAFSVPYVDLYEMYQDENNKQWILQETKGGRKLPHKKVKPFTQVILNGLSFDTVADPVDFLVQEYGKDYMVPKERQK